MKSNRYKFIVISVFILSSCHIDPNSSINLVSLFPPGGSDLNYITSYIAGINYAKETLGDQDGTITYQNINPLGEVINYKKIDAVIGTFTQDIYNDISSKRTSVPLITSQSDVYFENYDDAFNYFPLALFPHEESKSLARMIKSDVLIAVSYESEYKAYADTLTNALLNKGTEASLYYFLKDNESYDKAVHHLVSKDKDLILILNKRDYASVIFHLLQEEFTQDVYIPSYLAKHGSLPPSYSRNAFLIKHLNYTFGEVSEVELYSHYLDASQSEKYLNNYYYFRDGFFAYFLSYHAVINKNANESLTDALRNVYRTKTINEGFAIL